MKKEKATVLAALCIAGLLCACGEAKDNNMEKEATGVVENESLETDAGAPILENNAEADTEKTDVEETDTEKTVEEETANVAETGAMEEWLTGLGSQGICLAVWNEVDGTKHVIEEDETYVRNEGDRFFICTPSKFSKSHSIVAVDFKYEKPMDNYIEINFGDFSGKEDITYEVTCSGGEEGTVHFILVSSGTSTSSTGYEWAKSLGYDKPQMVVWNDTTGLRKELEEGETYQLCEGDKIGLYMPDNYVFNSANVEDAYVERGINIAILSLKHIDLGDKFDYEITIYNPDTSEKITSHVTLLPVQE